MTKTKRAILLLLILVLTACNAPGLGSIQLAAAPPPANTPLPPLVTSSPDATPTPTPFQPIPPTPVFIPTEYPTPSLTPHPTATPDPANQSQPVGDLSQSSDQITILLLGSDQRPWATNFRTDTIILVIINPSKGTVSMVSFPRDLYVHIPGFTMERINTAFYRGGFNTLADTLEYNFGIRPQHYVLVNFSSFKRAVDSLGGLTVNVGKSVSDFFPGRGYFTIPAGEVEMDADVVLWYVRSRKTSNDFARSRRQQEVLLAIFKKLLSLDVLRRVPEFYSTYKDSVKTDLGLRDLISLLPLATKLTDTSRIHNYFVGPKQVYDWITPGGGMVLLPRPGAIKRLLNRALKGQ